MIHFLRNCLYKSTFCGIPKIEAETATTHTMVTCPTCLDQLIAWKEQEVLEMKIRRSGIPNARVKKKHIHKQTEMRFDDTIPVDEGES